jgi:cell division GTPase FtsZ
MRIILIGVGGAGCRLVDLFYAQDIRSPVIRCLDGIAVDHDAENLNRLTALPADRKLYFQRLDPSHPDDIIASITIEEIIAKIQSLDPGDIDALVICGGLGGTMVDVIPDLVNHIRKAMIEPVFGLLILPCTREGPERSSRAADEIDLLFPALDGIILFDNETWYPKLKVQPEPVQKKQDSLKFLALQKQKVEESVKDQTYKKINDMIVRRVGLLLRAGEFTEKGGMDIAEVVLDAGEVLNTILGMGFITIGYAIEPVVQGSLDLDIIAKIRPAPPSIEESHKKASKVVDLAKRAIYQEISTPCDLTSAEKALILIAGPSHEMSMKGYMTVRKWIDRSIRGLEVRSGDYPVNNSHFLAIIIVLAGLRNVPRIDEIRKIRDRHKNPGVYDPDSTSVAARSVRDEYAGRDIVSEITEIAAGTRASPGADPLSTDKSGTDNGKDTDLHEKGESSGLVSRQDSQTDADDDDFTWVR